MKFTFANLINLLLEYNNSKNEKMNSFNKGTKFVEAEIFLALYGSYK